MARPEYEWGPWLTEGLPEVGEYIKIHVSDHTQTEFKDIEGYVTYVCYDFVGLSGKDTNGLLAHCWARRIINTREVRKQRFKKLRRNNART